MMENNFHASSTSKVELLKLLKDIIYDSKIYEMSFKGDDGEKFKNELGRKLNFLVIKEGDNILNQLFIAVKGLLDNEGRYCVRKFKNGKLDELYTSHMLNEALNGAIEWFNIPTEYRKAVTVVDIPTDKTILSL